MFTLSRLDHNKADSSQLGEMLENLKSFLNGRFDMSNEEWANQFDVIVNHQSGDGSFRIIDSFPIDIDARGDYCAYPTVICNAIIMKAILLFPERYEHLLPVLAKGLEASCKMGFGGGGFDEIDGDFDSIGIYSKAGLPFFLEKYPTLAPEFTTMIGQTTSVYAGYIENNDFIHGFNKNYESMIRAINSALTLKPIFTYGTLMKGERNHRFVEDQTFSEECHIYGYNLYNLGSFPGIRPSKNQDRTVSGEVYLVDKAALDRINQLEGEGSLYKLKIVEAISGETGIVAGAYVYNRKAKAESRIESGSWKEF